MNRAPFFNRCIQEAGERISPQEPESAPEKSPVFGVTINATYQLRATA
jgi:hypothetical protein